ncbi:MAG: ClbS/DfsB family four-helix bundle protein [Anaerolineae bacterium]|nr:ClbS/DfsB family four-helix bundle protein [Anaerolineae bacterium]
MNSRAQAKKEEIITALIEARREILDAAALLSAEQQDEVFLGVWSVKDLLAHLVGWDLANLAAADEVLAGQLPAFYAYHDRDWQTYNARLVAQYKKTDWAEMVASVEESHRKLVENVQTIPAEELDRGSGVRFRGWKVTIARLLQAEAGDEKQHAAQIREYWRLGA